MVRRRVVRSAAAMNVIDFSIYDEYRTWCVQQLEDIIQQYSTMPMQMLQQLCLGRCIETPRSCRKIFLKQLVCLRKHFLQTTSEAEDGDVFREDISRLMLRMYCLLNAGVGHAHHVVFMKWSPEVTTMLM